MPRRHFVFAGVVISAILAAPLAQAQARPGPNDNLSAPTALNDAPSFSPRKLARRAARNALLDSGRGGRRPVNGSSDRGQGAGLFDCGCASTEVVCDAPVSGTFSGECFLLSDGTPLEMFRLVIEERQEVTIELHSPDFDGYLLLDQPNCDILAENDDCAVDDLTRACISQTLAPGTYVVGVNSFTTDDIGAAFELSVMCSTPLDCESCLAGTVTCGGSVAGQLSAGDCARPDGRLEDVIRLDLDAPTRVDLSVRGAGELLPTFALTDAECQLINEAGICSAGIGDNCWSVELPAGVYYLRVSDSSSGFTGSYVVEAVCEAATDFCAKCVTGTVGCGETVSGDFPISACPIPEGAILDLYELEVVEASPLSVTLTSDDFAPFLTLYDATCVELARNNSCRGSVGACIRDFDLDPGTYFVGVSSVFADVSGTFDLSISCPDPGECRDCSVGRIECGESVNGEWDASDCTREGVRRETWEFRIDQPATVRALLATEDRTAEVALFNSSCGIVPASECADGTAGCVEYLGLSPGSYYLSTTSSATETTSYNLETRCLAFDICRDCVVREIADGELITGRFTDTDCTFNSGNPVDVYTFSTDQPARIQAIMTATQFSPWLTVYDEQCMARSTVVPCGPNSICLTAGLPPGNYSLGVQSLAPTDGNYSVTLSVSAPFDCSTCASGELSCDEPLTNSLPTGGCVLIGSGFLDVYELPVSSATSFELNAASSEFDPRLVLFNGDCIAFAENEDCKFSTDSCLTLDLEPGTYWVGVSSALPGESGSYTVNMTSDFCTVCDRCESGTVAPGQTVRGTLADDCTANDSKPADTWTLILEEERRLSFTLGGLSDLDLVLLLYNEACEEFANNDDCDLTTLGSCLEVTLGPGAYSVGVTTFIGNTGEYELSVSDAASGDVRPGDCNLDGFVDLSDGVCVLQALFSGRALGCGPDGSASPGNRSLLDFDASGDVTLTDAVGLLSFLFRGRAPHALGRECVDIADCPTVCPVR